MIWLRRILIGLGLGYALIAVGACAFQDKLLYMPDLTPVEAVSQHTNGYSTLTTSDGEELLVWTADAEPGCPTILFLHGNGGHIGRAQPLHEAIVERTGAGLMAVSWRGYTGSTGAPSQAGLVIDALVSFDALVSEGIDPTHIVVHGMSLGSYPATRVAAERDAAFLVLEAPFESVLSVAERRMPFLPVRWMLRDHYRTDLVIGDVVEPIYIVHGTDDRVIAPVHSQRLLAHAQAGAGRYVFADAGHNNLLQSGMMEQVFAPAIKRHFPRCRVDQIDTQPLQGEA